MTDERIVLGFDGSRSRHYATTDSTAIVGCRVRDGRLFLLGCWEEPPGPAGRDWQVPADEVDRRVREVFATRPVVGCYCDPNKWESWVATWEGDFGHKLTVKASAAHPMEWWPTDRRMARAVEQFHQAVIGRELSHDGDPILARHVLNARRKPTSWGVSIRKEHPASDRKIDCAIACVLAWECRLDALAQPFTQPATFIPRRIR
ncbi:MAG: hypothetical protein M3Q30_15310 [Actinomycetota bacterium]|nr:hypothetical protein [Actinomycetota bacterium]